MAACNHSHTHAYTESWAATQGATLLIIVSKANSLKHQWLHLPVSDTDAADQTRFGGDHLPE